MLHSAKNPPPSSALHPLQATITDRAVGVTPGGMSIPHPIEYSRVRGDFVLAGLGAIVDLARWSVDTAFEPVDLVLAPGNLDRAAIVAVAAAIASGAVSIATIDARFDGGLARVRSRAADLATSVLSFEPEQVLPDLVGAGPGTTPSGDDMIVGCLAALAVVGRTDAARRLAEATAPLLAATTITSRHYLEAAASGRFAEHVHDLVAGFETGRSAERILEHATRWGATSGVDLLIGMTATLRADLAARSEEGAA